MDITLRFTDNKDKTNKMKRVMMVVYKSKEKGYESIIAVNELPSRSILAKEVNMIAKELVALRKQELKDNKKKCEKTPTTKK